MEPPAPRPPPARSPASASVAPASADVVAARDKAIVDALKIRTRTFGGLRDVLPVEAGQTDDQRDAALSSALIRLRVKKVIRPDGESWAIA